MNTIAFTTANFVARPLDYNMTGGWGQGDRASNNYYQPLETYAERFGTLLRDIQAMGFTTLDLWQAHLNHTWATPEHIAQAKALMARYHLPVTSLCGWFGSNHEQFEAACRLAVTLGCRVLGGSTSMLQKDRAFVVDRLNEHDLVLALENHPEKPAEMLEKIGDGAGGRLGTTVDTGWYGTQGCDAVQAIEQLAEHIRLVHLKDVLAAGAHDTCRYGRGVVRVEACVAALRQQGYAGAITVEHEPEHFDPTDDCRANLAMLKQWLAA